MHGLDGANRWLMLIDGVLSGEKPDVRTRGEIGEYIHIGSFKTFIKGTESFPFPDIELATTDFRKLVAAWADGSEGFLAAKRTTGVWHDIPTSKESAAPEDTMYWDPFTKRTGLLKDTPEGRVWLRQLKRGE